MFNFTGGTLHADVVSFDLVNNGGAISPGHSIGQTHVTGNMTVTSGSLDIELASADLADMVVVDGEAMLGGVLDVFLLDGFTPTLGDNWQIITAGGISGMFSSVTAGYSVQRQGDNLLLYFGAAPPPALAGDYNDDHVVDAADYTVWRNNFGSTTILPNDPSPGVDMDDYVTWKDNFGMTTVTVSPSNSAVPEPTSLLLVSLAALGFSCTRMR